MTTPENLLNETQRARFRAAAAQIEHLMEAKHTTIDAIEQQVLGACEGVSGVMVDQLRSALSTLAHTPAWIVDKLRREAGRSDKDPGSPPEVPDESKMKPKVIKVKSKA